MSTFDTIATERVTRAMGPVSGAETMKAALRAIGRAQLESPADLLAFAEFLIGRRGVAEAVGRGLKVTAILRGAPTG